MIIRMHFPCGGPGRRSVWWSGLIAEVGRLDDNPARRSRQYAAAAALWDDVDPQSSSQLTVECQE